ncbi:FAD-binding oxidoreductase [Primorskyibacter sedentarius]|uniref:FAD-binding oxidoreductase n=1 Tax=Primorskyibacter sedentarius TaxID=745311 RepID=UPI003EC0BDD9
MSIASAIDALRPLFGNRLATSEALLEQHGTNESHFALALPDAVVFPESTQEVSDLMRICNQHCCPVVAFGTGTSLEGHHLPVQGGISLDMSRMNRVLRINAEDMDVVIQPGLTREELNVDLRATGLYFPVDPGANASLGGMAATRASGTTAVKFGTMKDNVLALEVVLADGRVIRTGSRARKSSAGYDLTRLMVGSEGTLGIITELTLRLQGQPEAVSAATCRFPSIEDAVNCVITTIQTGIPMARIELVDEMMVRGFNLYMKKDLPEAPHLFVEFQGSAAGVAEQSANFGAIAEDFGGSGFTWAEKPEDRNELWRMRHGGHYANNALQPGKKTLATDVCVPISQLAEAVTTAQRRSRELDITCTIVGHVGDGNFHCGCRVDPANAEEVARITRFAGELADMALRLGGTVTGEHGIGLGKMKYMGKEHSPDTLDAMRAIKAALDPNNILNPGKILPPPHPDGDANAAQ